jgi:GNAT superfamily N-acetyltransferase
VSLSIRQANPDELAEVSRIIREAFSIYILRIGKEPAPMRADHAAAIAAGQAFVAIVDRNIAGALTIEPKLDSLHIDILAVDAPYRRTGIAKALLSFAEERAAALGLGALTLLTNAAMTENLAMYPRLGFRETHRAMDEGYFRVFFRKEL